MPGPWSNADDSTAGTDDYPGRSDSVRRPGSLPLADFFTGPIAVVLGIAIVCVGIPMLAWGGLLAAMLVLATGVTVTILDRGLVELLKPR